MLTQQSLQVLCYVTCESYRRIVRGHGKGLVLICPGKARDDPVRGLREPTPQ